MGNFRAEILAHSVNPVGDEAVTFEICVERFIWAEVLTHRWSRNASSSRAIPYKRMRSWIEADPALPLHLGRNRPGMQSGGMVDESDSCRASMLRLHDVVADYCDEILVGTYDLHKEIVNRYLEPFGWINGVMTMGRPQLMNFFKLRMDPHAHPNMQRLAVSMARRYRESTPRPLAEGQWHLPYVKECQREDCRLGCYPVEDLVVWSVAHCAWCSYKTVDGKDATWEKARRRHDDCVTYKHMTPCEHQLRARGDHGRNGGCVAGFDSYRMMIPGESCGDLDYAALLDTTYKDADYVIP